LSFSRGIKDLTSFSFINEGKAFNISIKTNAKHLKAGGTAARAPYLIRQTPNIST
jgi:hypothetical protein